MNIKHKFTSSEHVQIVRSEKHLSFFYESTSEQIEI